MRLVFNLHNDSNEPDRLVSPHFDDETTLLSARPVVPLGQLNSTFRTKRVVALLGTAVLSGFVGGLILIRLERARGEVRNGTLPSASSTLTAPPEVASTDQNKESAVTKALETPSADHGIATAQEPMRTPEPKKRTIDREVSVQMQKQNEKDKAERLRLESMRDAKRAERKAESVRERRTTGRNDDIFRIGDIFEGSRRP